MRSSASTPTSAKPSRGRILLADDDQDAREGIAQVLERHGYSCHAVCDASEAILHLQREPWDALITDVFMPGNTGLELIEQVNTFAPGLPVFVITGRPAFELAARAVRLAVSGFLTKPPDYTELVDLLDHAISGYTTLRSIRAGRGRLEDWAVELRRFEEVSRSLNTGSSAEPLKGFLRISIRQMSLMLLELDRVASTLDKADHGSTARELDLTAAVQRTIEVIEKTRRNFKSRELADLRRSLEDLLADDPDPGAGI